jgi:succinate dehydrogenase/fumarate reductase-like Fe-S protein
MSSVPVASWLSGLDCLLLDTFLHPLPCNPLCRWMIDSRDDFTQERMQSLNDQCE